MAENKSNIDALIREIRQEVRKTGSDFNKFLEMVASFKEEITEEYKLFRTAMKSMKVAGLGQAEVIKGADMQLARLKEQEKMMSDSLAAKRAEFKALVDRTAEIEGTLKTLRQEVSMLEDEKAAIAKKSSDKQAEIKTVETNFKMAASHLEKEISGIKARINKYMSEDYVPEPALGLNQQIQPESNGNGVSIASEERLTTPPSEGARKESSDKERVCPQCSGRLDWYAMEKMWRCYTCGHEIKPRKKNP